MQGTTTNIKRIFTFWEPKETIPEYLKLCLKTWEKFLSDYEIIILNYDNLKNWLDKSYYPDYLFTRYSLPIQSDAIRAAILKLYGGIWMDIDTILTSSKIKDLLAIKSDFILINKHIAFIKANKNSEILNQWNKGIQKNLDLYKKYHFSNSSKITKWLLKKIYYKNIFSWDCLGNQILKKYLKTKNKQKFYKIDAQKIYALPERNYLNENSLNYSMANNYANFWFKKNYADYVLQNSEKIVLLHNSWTPEEYKTMKQEDFINSNCTLANVLKEILKD